MVLSDRISQLAIHRSRLIDEAFEALVPRLFLGEERVASRDYPGH